MRVLAFLIAALTVITGAFAVEVQKSVIITYPDDTPDSVLVQAKQAIEAGGGVVTHDYQLIKGFAAKMGEKLLDTVTGWGKQYNALIEEDQVVSAL